MLTTVLREALQLLAEHDAREERKLEALHRDIQEGQDEIDRGDTMDAFGALREMRRRLGRDSGPTR